ncbi:MAG: PQQ-like beta-propeller repeat protein [Deltaproteobacteria bacterium]|nr:PQQ-like beta-propeller repeat protein [Deltaproteobacteria bacterium]
MRRRKIIAQIAIVSALAVFSILHGCDCTVRVFVESDATWHHRDAGSDERGTTEDGTTEDGAAATDSGSDSSYLSDVSDSGDDALDAGGPDAGGDTGSADAGASRCPIGNEGEVVFTFQADAKISGTPAVAADGTIFFGTSHATFYAVGCDGNKKWEWRCPCEAQAFDGSPAIGDDGTIYVGDDVVVPNYLFALNPDGTEKWRYEAQGVNSEMDSSPALGSDGTIYIGSGHYVMDGPFGALHAFTPGGQAVAGFPIPLDGAAVASAAVKGDTLFAASTSLNLSDSTFWSEVFAVARDGTKKWTTQLGGAASSVAVGGSGSVYITESVDPGFDPTLPRTNLVVLDPADGRVVRTIHVSAISRAAGAPAPSAPIVASAAFGEDVILMLEDGRLVSSNPQSGGVVTEFDIKLGDFGHGSPVLGDDGFIYAAVEKDDFTYATLLFKVSRDGTSSTQIASFTGERVSTSLAMGANGAVCFGTESGKLITVKTGATGIDMTAPWPAFRHDERNTGNADYVPKHPCAPKERLWASISPYYPGGDVTYSETIQVTYKGISLPGGTCNLMYFDAWDSEHRVELCYNLPFGYEIPVSEGEIVKLSMAYNQGAECCYAQRMYIWDTAQNLRFYFYSGDPAYFEPYECADPKYCPAVSFADAVCVPVEEDCGKAVHPPIRFSMGAQRCDRIVQQGEAIPYAENDGAVCAAASSGKLVAVESTKILEQECVDYPNATLTAIVFNNSWVSQCLCQDHYDCAPGYVCETEARRCVENKCAAVRCEQGYHCNPYTGECLAPPPGVVVSCENSADCAAAGGGVCNTVLRGFTGSGFCQPNPCEYMDCANACSPLLGVCWECLTDCDCYVPEQAGGVCETDTLFCSP